MGEINIRGMSDDELVKLKDSIIFELNIRDNTIDKMSIKKEIIPKLREIFHEEMTQNARDWRIVTSEMSHVILELCDYSLNNYMSVNANKKISIRRNSKVTIKNTDLYLEMCNSIVDLIQKYHEEVE